MKLLWLPVLFVISGVTVTAVAQSRRAEPKIDGKRNQRPAVPSPTPLLISSPSLQAADDQPEDGEVIRVDTQVVSVPVRVMDKRGRFVGGLIRENFKVFEDGAEQEIGLFSNEHQPFTVALVLDMSYSTKFKIGDIQSAAIAFIEQLRPEDQVMVVSFDGEVHLLCEATNDRKAIYRAIKSTKIATGTSLYEAIDLVINNRMRTMTGRKAVILFTDGVDTTSRRASDLNNLNDAMELDSLIYTIRYDTFADVQKMKSGPRIAGPPPISSPIPTSSGSLPFPLPGIGTPGSQGTTAEEYKKGEEYLQQMTTRTGGRLYQATTLVNLADAYSQIASELREFYSIGYYPVQSRTPGKKTSVKVKVDRENLVVRSREGFIRRKSVK